VKRQILFVQGGGRGVHEQWDQKLVDSLRRELGPEYEVHYPRMPAEAQPKYASWKPTLERELRALEPGAILVGHSVGGTILVAVLAEESLGRELGGIFLLAAPFAGDGGWPSDDLRFPSGLGARLPRGIPIHFFQGLDDQVVPPSHIELYARAVPQAHVHRLPGRDHQLNADMSEVAHVISALERQRQVE
jgi:predicted alpha/beta hydrolase family esterase